MTTMILLSVVWIALLIEGIRESEGQSWGMVLIMSAISGLLLSMAWISELTS